MDQAPPRVNGVLPYTRARAWGQGCLGRLPRQSDLCWPPGSGVSGLELGCWQLVVRALFHRFLVVSDSHSILACCVCVIVKLILAFGRRWSCYMAQIRRLMQTREDGPLSRRWDVRHSQVPAEDMVRSRLTNTAPFLDIRFVCPLHLSCSGWPQKIHISSSRSQSYAHTPPQAVNLARLAIGRGRAGQRHVLHEYASPSTFVK
jgi:hypothetical protein